MPIPDFQSVMLPLLQFAAASPITERSTREAVDFLANHFKLTEQERTELLPSGRQPIFDNRVGWATTYFKKAGLLSPSKRGYFKITQRGLDLFATSPPKVNVRLLKQFPEFVEFHQKPIDAGDKIDDESTAIETRTPEEVLELEYDKIRKQLASELLERIRQAPPAFFERLVIELLVKMGYGGSRADAGKAIGRTGDEGIDGIIKEDKLGLDVIYVQAKRWKENSSISRPSIQQFAGALQGQQASKGIFITTSTFTKEALAYVAKIGSKIVLIDGEQLAQLMIDHNVGVSVSATYEIKRIDSDYFAEQI
jgi:restriction system protein